MSHHKIEQTKTTADKVANFISNNRVLLWISLGALIVITIVIAVVDNNIQNRNDMYSDKAVEIQESFQEWFAAAEEDKESIESDFLAEIDAVIEDDKMNILSERALFLRGQFYLQKENWDGAFNDFNRIATDSPESYLASVSLYNAASAQENSGDSEGALATLTKLVDTYRETSPLLPETLFNIGRLNESLNNSEAAIEAYDDLATTYSSSSWTNLAKTRIISLKASGVSQ